MFLCCKVSEVLGAKFEDISLQSLLFCSVKNAGLSYRCCQGNFDKWFTRHFTRACAQRASAAVRSFWKCIWERTISWWCSFSSIHSIEVVKSFIQKKSCLHSCVSNRLIGSSCRLHCSGGSTYNKTWVIVVLTFLSSSHHDHLLLADL